MLQNSNLKGWSLAIQIALPSKPGILVTKMVAKWMFIPQVKQLSIPDHDQTLTFCRFDLQLRRIWQLSQGRCSIPWEFKWLNPQTIPWLPGSTAFHPLLSFPTTFEALAMHGYQPDQIDEMLRLLILFLAQKISGSNLTIIYIYIYICM